MNPSIPSSLSSPTLKKVVGTSDAIPTVYWVSRLASPCWRVGSFCVPSTLMKLSEVLGSTSGRYVSRKSRRSSYSSRSVQSDRDRKKRTYSANIPKIQTRNPNTTLCADPLNASRNVVQIHHTSGGDPLPWLTCFLPLLLLFCSINFWYQGRSSLYVLPSLLFLFLCRLRLNI